MMFSIQKKPKRVQPSGMVPDQPGPPRRAPFSCPGSDFLELAGWIGAAYWAAGFRQMDAPSGGNTPHG